ncbi:response regulator [Pontibacter silvestris]|uniref:Response regulator n=1 Tax=Pontibacter silvestris TaxID=2305183 RepID=A0ABW4X195_9BACT|nr:response regulator transcription factor [Pontibacter silvestris]MCC9135894.1 response regulator transcription factor [Pontibacter silvestris]
MGQKIRIGVVEDSQVFVKSLELYFSMSDSVEMAFATDELEAIPELCKKHKPDVILMDVNLGYFTGIEGLKLVLQTSPHIKVLMLTAISDDKNLFDAIAHGASGYLLKGIPASDVESSIIETYKGGAPMTPIVASRILQVFRQNNLSQRPHEDLTHRENDILKALVKGLSYKQVATELNISLGTVRTHIEHIYAKLGVNSKAEAVAKFLQGLK